MPFYMLLSGVHSQGGKVYNPGDVFEASESIERHNKKGNRPRYQRVEKQEAVAKDPTVGLERKTLADLQAMAEELGIDLDGVVLKADVIEAIRKALEE